MEAARWPGKATPAVVGLAGEEIRGGEVGGAAWRKEGVPTRARGVQEVQEGKAALQWRREANQWRGKPAAARGAELRWSWRRKMNRGTILQLQKSLGAGLKIIIFHCSRAQMKKCPK